jgi:hypothetical protein
MQAYCRSVGKLCRKSMVKKMKQESLERFLQKEEIKELTNCLKAGDKRDWGI